MKQNSFVKGVRTLKRRGMSHKAAVNKMRYYAAKNDNYRTVLSPKAIFYLLLVILFAIIGADKKSAIATKLFVGAIVGVITFEVAGSLVKKFGGKILKRYSYTFEMGQFKFSISAFVIVTIFIELWLFT